MKPFIETFLGGTIAPLSPKGDDIRIEDIAHALSNQSRFSGHTRFFYSVAEHSVRVSEAVKAHDALWGLLHDASEAYLIDLPTPLKLTPSIGDPYRVAEAKLMRVICRHFGLSRKMPHSVVWGDAALLATEVRDLMHADRDYWAKLTADPLPGRIRPWSPEVAEFEFLRRFKELGGK